MHEIQPRLIGACSIEVGDTELTPAASHLFALLLAFCLAPRDPWTRRGLQGLLFGDASEPGAAHRLRQLLYRLRGFGVVLQESSTGVIRLANPVVDPLDLLDAADLVAPPRTSARLDPLGLYTPRMPAPFLDWLEQRRDVLRAALATRRLAELRTARERQDWTACARLASTLYAIDPIDEEIVIAVAESSAMLGRRDTALDAIDQLLRDTGDSLEARPSLKRLRARIASTRIPRREGTLRGRDQCLAFLSTQWERATSGRGGHVCALFGGPGMGKSRVGETFAGAMRLGGAQVLHHRCDGHARQTPLALFAQLVPDLRRRRGSIGADPALSEVLDHLAPGSAAPPALTRVAGTVEERRDEVRRAIVDLLESVSTEQPMLIVVDDAHLLDEASRSVIRSIADSTNVAQLLVVLLCRPRPDGQTLLSMSPRFGSYALAPLDDADSRALLLELSEHRPLTEAQVAWALAQADGNAFYLHALAQHPSDGVEMPAHIKSLAHTSYLGVSADARTVLDSCLLLDTLATPARVTRVAGVDDRTLLAAVRELEDADLLRYEDGLFAGPHAIIRDVLEELMPSTARALLQHRIAEMLSVECDDPARARMVGWAAVRAWLACGDSEAAVRLALKVARDAAALGEPEAGAVLLSQVPREVLEVKDQSEVLDAMIEFADTGNRLLLLSQALDERRALSVLRQEGSSAVAEFTIRQIATDHVAGRIYDVNVAKLILADQTINAPLRAEAASRILAHADLHYDQRVAAQVYAELEQIQSSELRNTPAYLRAQLVYHTTFGCREASASLITDLLAQFPDRSTDSESRKSHCYATFALLRMGRYSESAALATANCLFEQDHRNLFASEYFATIAAEAFINLGAFEEAQVVMSRLPGAIGKTAGDRTSSSGARSTEILLAIARGDTNAALRILGEAKERHRLLTAPRLRAAVLAYTMRVAQLRGSAKRVETEAFDLSALFALGRHYGAQDTIVEALWHHRVEHGDHEGASTLLLNYLRARREIGAPEALLCQSTRSDCAWSARMCDEPSESSCDRT